MCDTIVPTTLLEFYPNCTISSKTKRFIDPKVFAFVSKSPQQEHKLSFISIRAASKKSKSDLNLRFKSFKYPLTLPPLLHSDSCQKISLSPNRFFCRSRGVIRFSPHKYQLQYAPKICTRFFKARYAQLTEIYLVP